MNQILEKPFRIIWLAIPVVFCLSLIGPNRSIDIQLHDTYLVIYSMHLGILFSSILGLIGLIYWLVRFQKLIKWLTNIHVITTVLTTLSIVLTNVVFRGFYTSNFENFRLINQILLLLIIGTIMTQIGFFVNIAYSVIKSNVGK